jgi:hypothetical protein
MDIDVTHLKTLDFSPYVIKDNFTLMLLILKRNERARKDNQGINFCFFTL